MSRIYLTNLASDVAGYKLALVDTRPPVGSGDSATTVTATTSMGDNIEMTLTSGGTVSKWITKPFLADVAIGTDLVYCHLPAVESNASANAGLGVRLAEYTTSQQSAFLDLNHGTELTTTSNNPLTAGTSFVTSAPTATTIDAGNRLVIALDVVAVGTMGASQTVTMGYGGETEGGAADAFLVFNEKIRVSESQFGSGTSVKVLGQGQGSFQETIERLQFFEGAGLLGSGDTVTICDQLGYERDNN